MTAEAAFDTPNYQATSARLAAAAETVRITIYGASDDLVEVTVGDKADEYTPGHGDRWYADLIAPDGARMRVHCEFDGDSSSGCWQVGVGQVAEEHQLPGWPVTITQAPAMNPDNPGYSALLTILAPDGTVMANIVPDPETGE